MSDNNEQNYDIPNCEKQGHHLNKVETWINGQHCFGTIQGGVCGSKLKYDYKFPVGYTNSVAVYKVKQNGQWTEVNYYDLVFDFEEDEEQEQTQPLDQKQEPENPSKISMFEKIKNIFR